MYNNRNYAKWAVLPEQNKTIAHIIKEAGYATALAGKWQLSNDGMFPRQAGFDTNSFWAYGFDLEKIGFQLKYPSSTPGNYYFNTQHPKERYMVVNAKTPTTTSRYFYPCLIQDDADFVVTTDNDYGPDINCDFAIQFIEKHQYRPFFLYIPMELTHDPFIATPGTPGVASMTLNEKFKKNPKNFKGMVEWMDKKVGQVLDKLQELGLEENTIVIFTGDNGTGRSINSRMKDGSVIKGGKGLSTDAGIHVPLIVQWKGKIKANTQNSDLVDFTDFMPTLAEVAGAKLPSGSDFIADGRSFLPQLLGKKGAPRDWVFFPYDRNPPVAEVNPNYLRSRFIRNKEYKLYDNGELYNIQLDVEETNPIVLRDLPSRKRAVLKNLQLVLDTMPKPPGFTALKETIN